MKLQKTEIYCRNQQNIALIKKSEDGILKFLLKKDMAMRPIFWSLSSAELFH